MCTFVEHGRKAQGQEILVGMRHQMHGRHAASASEIYYTWRKIATKVATLEAAFSSNFER